MVSVEQAKEWLYRYKDLMADIAALEERMENLKESLGTQSVNFDDMPRSKSPIRDRIGHLTAIYVDLSNEMEQMCVRATDVYKETDLMIERIRGRQASEMKAILRLRYFNMLTWNDVTDAMFMSADDYLGHEDSYLRRVHNRHKAALETIAEFIPAPVETAEAV